MECNCVDIGFLVYRLMEIIVWFTDNCAELREIMDCYKPIPSQLALAEIIPINEEAMAV